MYSVLEGPFSAGYDKGAPINDYKVLEGPDPGTHNRECTQNHYNVLEESCDPEIPRDSVGVK